MLSPNHWTTREVSKRPNSAEFRSIFAINPKSQNLMFLEDRFLTRKTVANARIVTLLMVRFQCCETLRWHS